MKICNEHWGELREGIKEKGMWHLVSKDGNSAISRIKKDIKDEVTIRDPLMNAMFAIFNNAIEQGGPYLLTADENGNPYCPLCELNKHGGDHKVWIGYAVDEQLKSCIKEGLLNNQ